MATTIQAGTVHSIFGIDSIDAVVSAIVGDFRADYDTGKLAEMITADREALLPDGWTIHGDIVIRDVDAPDLPETWRESLLDAEVDVNPEDARIN